MRLYEDVRALEPRVGALQALALGLFALLIAYFWYLQVLKGRYYRELAENNRIRTIPIAAPRGPLLDQKGRILVENRASFNIVLQPDHPQELDATVARLAGVLNMGEAQIRERWARRSAFRPVVVKADATLADVAAVEARRLELPDVAVEVMPLRSYPLAAAAAHALGRVGEVTEKQLQSPDFESLNPGDLVGQAGVELQYNRALMGRDGRRRVVVNSRGLEVTEADREPPVGGPQLTLTLDADLQRELDDAFGGLAGSAVALDPNTGEILAMSSLPSYDPNQFSSGIDVSTWSRLASDASNPLINRVLQGQYAPGSVFKLVVAIAALESNAITPQTTFYCPGYFSAYNTVFRCNRATGHGVVGIHKALQHSCNVFFYQLGVRLGVDVIARYARLLGLGSPAGIDLPHESPGLIPDSAWKLRTQRSPWYPGETVSVAIGQGQVLTTPLQLARMAAAVGTGMLAQPHIVRAIGDEELPLPPPRQLGLKPETLAIVAEGMRAVVNDQGTGWRARVPGIAVCGKTGSAQVVSHARLTRGKENPAFQAHGWFVAFAPAAQPRIALAVLIEHGGSGGEAAAPVARRFLERFFGTRAAPSVASAGAAAAAGGR